MSTLRTMPNGDTCNEASGESWRVVTAADGSTVLADLVNGVTWTKLPMLDDSDPDALAGQVTAPAWQTGTEYATDALVTDASGTVWICRQQHTSQAGWEPGATGTLALWQRLGNPNAVGAAWATSTPYEVGQTVTYNSATYACLQAHTSQTTWEPPNAPALWALQQQAGPGAWTYPIAYAVGDLVTYQGTTYKCLQAHTSQAGWHPDAVPALWQAQ